MSMNAKASAFPDEIAKRCLLIYSSASLPSDDEKSRIAMSDELGPIKPTTHFFRRYVNRVLDQLDADEQGNDWLDRIAEHHSNRIDELLPWNTRPDTVLSDAA